MNNFNIYFRERRDSKRKDQSRLAGLISNFSSSCSEEISFSTRRKEKEEREKRETKKTLVPQNPQIVI